STRRVYFVPEGQYRTVPLGRNNILRAETLIKLAPMRVSTRAHVAQPLGASIAIETQDCPKSEEEENPIIVARFSLLALVPQSYSSSISSSYSIFVGTER